MGSLGSGELVLLLLLGLLLLGPEQMAGLTRQWRTIRGRLVKLRMDFEDEMDKAIPKDLPSQKDLRRMGLEWLQGVSKDARMRMSSRVVQHLREWEVLKNAHTMAAFIPLSSEPDLTPLFSEWLAEGKHLLVPRLLEEGLMEFVSITDMNQDLLPGPLGIRQPHTGLQASTRKPDVILVPGVVFGPAGERIGRGRGYYDRYLAQMPRIPTAGICFSGQVRGAGLPQSRTDVRMFYIVSETGVLCTHASETPTRIPQS